MTSEIMGFDLPWSCRVFSKPQIRLECSRGHLDFISRTYIFGDVEDVCCLLQMSSANVTREYLGPLPGWVARENLVLRWWGNETSCHGLVYKGARKCVLVDEVRRG